MTAEEVKARYSMDDLLERYGYKKNRAGFICCPFHKEKTPSMKIYADSFHCFGCGKHGDIFDFVMFQENCGFREAFKSLGGTTENNLKSKFKAYTMAKARRNRARMAEKEHENKKVCISRQEELIALIGHLEPLSGAWDSCYKELFEVTVRRAELMKEEDPYDYAYTFVSRALILGFNKDKEAG
jgi:hypothetical protein